MWAHFIFNMVHVGWCDADALSLGRGSWCVC